MDYESYSGVDDPDACLLCGEQGCTDAQCDERCPGCGAKAGDGLTAGCHHPDGCGWAKAQHGGLSSRLPEPTELRMHGVPKLHTAFDALARALYANGYTPMEIASRAFRAATNEED